MLKRISLTLLVLNYTLWSFHLLCICKHKIIWSIVTKMTTFKRKEWIIWSLVESGINSTSPPIRKMTVCFYWFWKSSATEKKLKALNMHWKQLSNSSLDWQRLPWRTVSLFQVSLRDVIIFIQLKKKTNKNQQVGKLRNVSITLKNLHPKWVSSHLYSNHLDPLVHHHLIPGFPPLALEDHSRCEQQGPCAECRVWKRTVTSHTRYTAIW